MVTADKRKDNRLRHQKYIRTEKGKAAKARADKKYKSRPEIKSKKSIAGHLRYEEKSRGQFLKQRYGITVEQYNSMLFAQHGVCAICGRPPKSRRLAVDHDHSSGKIRGLLCFRCNKFVIGKQTVEKAKRVYEYLIREKALGL